MAGDLQDELRRNIMLLNTADAPGGVMVYYADGDEEIIHANQYTIELFSCSTFEELLDYTGGTFHGFVHDDEIDRIEEAIWMQVQERNGFDHVFYHILSKSGRMVSVDDYGRLVEKEGERPVFYVFLAEADRQEARDWLTGLPELAHFKHLAALETLNLHDANIGSILVFDLMGMKSFNATYGRDDGDAMLRTFADILRKHFGSDACCRHAGDRFFAFAPTEGIASKVESVFDEFANSGIEGVLPVMAGVSSFNPGDDVSTVLDCARLACDSDNSTWSSHLTWFNGKMRSDAELRAYILEHLDQAIANRWLRPYYQAIMRSTTDSVCGEEALARWIDPKYGMLSPATFIPVLEHAGLLHKLDLHMVDCVIEDFKTKIQAGTPLAPVSVNMSLRDFGELDVASEVTRRVRDAGLSPKLIKIEFTESVATSNPVQLHEQIAAFHDAGFSVWADDFGSGYSSFNTISEFDFDLIKLDMEFARHLENERSRTIVEGIVHISQKLGIVTLAEGVETPEQVRFLKGAGCAMLQGFHYTEPKPLDVIQTNAREGRGFKREDITEFDYWNTVGLLGLENPIANSDDWHLDDNNVREFPAAVLEHRGDKWNTVRMNESYVAFFSQAGVLDRDDLEASGTLVSNKLDPDFEASARRALESGTWEPIAGQIEYGTGLQFFTKHIASGPGADAFVSVSTPAMLGTALGSYGDVPVAYAVFKVVPNEAGDGLDDMRFIFANNEYCDFTGVEQSKILGKSFIETVGDEGALWLPYCYRAAVLKEKVHDVLHIPERNHVFSFNAAPSSIEGCCAFVFTVADDKQ